MLANLSSLVLRLINAQVVQTALNGLQLKLNEITCFTKCPVFVQHYSHLSCANDILHERI